MDADAESAVGRCPILPGLASQGSLLFSAHQGPLLGTLDFVLCGVGRLSLCRDSLSIPLGVATFAVGCLSSAGSVGSDCCREISNMKTMKTSLTVFLRLLRTSPPAGGMQLWVSRAPLALRVIRFCSNERQLGCPRV